MAIDWLGYADRCTRAVRNVLGRDAVYQPLAGGPSYAVRAPFDDEHLTSILESAAIGDTVAEPQFDVRLEDLEAYPVQGDTITISRPGEAGDAVFEVTEVQRGGQGTAVLMLTLAEAPL